MFGKLYIVATPIGNLDDISNRALGVLKKAHVILAEDTRVTGKLLRHYGIENNLLPYHHHSSEQKKYEILKLLVDGKDLALVTDAGTPGISDPGNELVDFIYESMPETDPTIEIIPIPGPSALATALSVCGFSTSHFLFIGFLPKKGRTKLFTQMSEADETIVFFDSPNRIIKTLNEVAEYFTNRRIFVARELTKMHETHYRGTVKNVLEKLQNDNVKGEFVVVIEGK